MQKNAQIPSGTFRPYTRTSGLVPATKSKGATDARDTAPEQKRLKRRNCTHTRVDAALPSMPKELQRPPRRPRHANTSGHADPFGQGELLQQIINAKSFKALDHVLASPQGQGLSAMSELKHCPDAALLKKLTGAQTGPDLDKVRHDLQSRPLSPIGPETAWFATTPQRRRMTMR